MSANSDERLRAGVGPRDLKQVGSVQWCWQTVHLLQTLTGNLDANWRDVDSVMAELKAARAWEKIPPERPYGSMAALVQAETGTALGRLEQRLVEYGQVAALHPVGTNQSTIARQDEQSGQTGVTRPSGYSHGWKYEVARLGRDRPDLHARVLAGELSPPAAMIEAGFPSPDLRLRIPVNNMPLLASHIRRQLTEKQIRQLAELLTQGGPVTPARPGQRYREAAAARRARLVEAFNAGATVEDLAVSEGITRKPMIRLLRKGGADVPGGRTTQTHRLQNISDRPGDLADTLDHERRQP